MTTSRISPLRFHLMIGAASSGKSTAARILARLLQEREQRRVRYVSSAEIRRRLYGDRGVLGQWAEVEAEIGQQLLEAIAAQESVIVEASYVRRAFRLAITQALVLPVAVQWIGWWLDTPLEQCLEWNRQRPVGVPEAVIQRHCAQLLQAAPVPQRQEGFALVVRLRSDQGLSLERLIGAELERLEACQRRGANRDGAYRLHGYARLLDLERLLYLIRLLSEHPKLTATGETVDGELEHLLAPLPSGGIAQRAAALLGRLHGACYGDAEAVSQDLAWLDGQGFTGRWLAVDEAALPLIEPPPWPQQQGRPLGGLPRLADLRAFQRVFTLLRYLLRHPHDLTAGERVAEHLACSLNASSAAGRQGKGGMEWTARQVQVAINDTLTPYGFRLPGRSGRRGYSLGTALLSLAELRQACELLQLQADGLGDSQAGAISGVLRERLAALEDRQGGLRDGDGGAMPRRRWILPTPALAVAREPLELIETAIGQRQRLLLSRHGPAGGARPSRSSGHQAVAVWPLQLLLHGGRWWLLVEHDAIGQPMGLLSCLELEQLHVYQHERRPGRERCRHEQALERARLLERRCGGLCFGESLAAQQALGELVSPGRADGASANASAACPWLVRLRLRCSAAAMRRLRRDLDRFWPRAVRLAAALPGDSWGRVERGSRQLRANDDPRHPYPVEVELPEWVAAGDGELRRWLFSYGGELRIEAPAALAAEHQQWLSQALAAYGAAAAAAEAPAGPERCAGVAGAGVEQKRELGGPVRMVRKRLGPASAKSGAARVRAQRRQRC
jgi:predicted kinase